MGKCGVQKNLNSAYSAYLWYCALANLQMNNDWLKCAW